MHVTFHSETYKLNNMNTTPDQLKSIPISFGDIKFKDSNHCGRIIGDQPWIHVDVITTVTVFEPLVGAKIRGKITKVAICSFAI